MPNIKKKHPKEARKLYGYFTAWVGIVANIFLCASKFIFGLISGSVAIMADAVNNLSDISTSVMSLISFKISAKVPDEDHPFGHARFEYVFSFVMSVIIMFIGGQFLSESIKKIINPTNINRTTGTLIILILSILIKIYLYFFYKKMSIQIDSEMLNAASGDSLSDILATSVILISFIFDPLVSFSLDGIIGTIVAFIILKNGYDILRRVLDLIVGSNLNKEELEKIKRWLYTHDGVLGVHDLIVHDYGPGHRFVTVHIEVDSRISLRQAHAIADDIENAAVKIHHWQMVAHIDPLDVTDPELNAVREMTNSIVKRINENLSIHDFRIIHGHQSTKLIFDCDVPNDINLDDKQIKKKIQQELDKEEHGYEAYVTFDRNYIRSSVK